jgi:PadR family transcriptional regulator PadR
VGEVDHSADISKLYASAHKLIGRVRRLKGVGLKKISMKLPNHRFFDGVEEIMESLGELELIVLLAVLRSGDAAYGVPVQQEIERNAGRSLTLATIYKTLARLQTKALVTSQLGEPTATRGGRAKRYFAVTSAGREAVRQSLSTLRRMAMGLGVGMDTP